MPGLKTLLSIADILFLLLPPFSCPTGMSCVEDGKLIISQQEAAPLHSFRVETAYECELYCNHASKCESFNFYQARINNFKR